ncbi:MAG: hypothetical protein V9E87_05725 [Gemmatimonadales bacterium]
MSVVIAQVMNGSTTRPCSCSPPAISGIDATIATTPAPSAKPAFRRSVAYSAWRVSSRSVVAAIAPWSGDGSDAP